MNTSTPNLRPDRLNRTIERLKGNVVSAEAELQGAIEQAAASAKLIEADAEWTRQDAMCADPSLVAEFEARLAWHRQYLAHHVALLESVESEVAA